MDRLKQAIFDCDIQNHGDKVRPYDPKADKRKSVKQTIYNSARSRASSKGKQEDVIAEESEQDSDDELKKSKTSGAIMQTKAVSDLLSFQKSAGRQVDNSGFNRQNSKKSSGRDSERKANDSQVPSNVIPTPFSERED